MPLPSKLPDGVVEVIPNMLFVGPAKSAKAMLVDFGVRRVVCCADEGGALPYQEYVDTANKSAVAAKLAEAKLKQPKPASSATIPVESNPPSKSEGADGPNAGEEDVEAVEGDTASRYEVMAAQNAETLTRLLSEDVVHVARCPMEDTLEYRISGTESVPKAVDFIDAAVRTAENKVREAKEEAEEQSAAEHDADCPHAAEKKETAVASPAGEPESLCHACYVHCTAGVSRSPTVVLAYLITRKNMLLEDAMLMLAPHCRPNPSFILQLVNLEEESTATVPSTFNVLEYNISGLMSLFPALGEKDVRDAMAAVGNDVVRARSTLMKKSLFANRDEAMLSAIVGMVNTAYVSRAEVEQMYAKCGKQRDAALYKLLELQNAREEEALQNMPPKR